MCFHPFVSIQPTKYTELNNCGVLNHFNVQLLHIDVKNMLNKKIKYYNETICKQLMCLRKKIKNFQYL